LLNLKPALIFGKSPSLVRMKIPAKMAANQNRVSIQWLPVAVALPLLGACGAGQDLTAPWVGALEVNTLTTGGIPDADGYRLILDSVEVETIGVNASALRPGLAPGRHSVALTGLAANCVTDGANPRAVTVLGGSTVSISFSITCMAPPEFGVLELSVSTAGVDPDIDGYEVFVDPDIVQAIPVDGTARVDSVLAGSRVVRLAGVAENCTAPRTVDTIAVQPNETVHTAFQVTCWPPLVGRLAYSRDGEIFVVNADGTNLRRLQNVFPADEYPEWSPDGSRIVFTRAEAIYTMNADGTDTAAITADTFPQGVKFPRWSPNGRRILFWASDDDEGGSLYYVNPNGTGLQLSSINSVIWASWSPDGQRLAAILAVFIQIGETCCVEYGVYLINPDGTEKKELVSPEDTRYDMVEWSPDGSRLVLVNDRGIHVSDTSATAIRPIFTPPGDFVSILGVDWSPDGARLAFWRDFSGTGVDRPDGLHIINVDGTGLLSLAEGQFFFGTGGISWGP
jgi:WD40 repeat protein